MSEETEKNPLEMFLEKMEELFSLQVEQNKELNNTIQNYRTIMRSTSEDYVYSQKKFESLSEKLIYEIYDSYEHGLKTMEGQVSRMDKSLKNLDTHLYTAIEKATKNISGVKLSLNEKDRKALSDTETQIKKYKSIAFLLVGLVVFCLITVSATIYAASSFYNTSVLSKEEMRQNILDDIQRSEQEIYSTSYFHALENERQIIEVWKNANPNDSKSYLEFRNQVIKDYANRGIPYFETLISDETSDGYGKRFKKKVFD